MESWLVRPEADSSPISLLTDSQMMPTHSTPAGFSRHGKRTCSDPEYTSPSLVPGRSICREEGLARFSVEPSGDGQPVGTQVVQEPGGGSGERIQRTRVGLYPVLPPPAAD